MFGSSILEVAIGVIFIYLLLSLICTVINEFIASVINRRGTNLFEGIKNLLNDPTFTGLAQKLYNHGLVDGISQPSKNPNKPNRWPSYMDKKTFALALLDNLSSQSAIDSWKLIADQRKADLVTAKANFDTNPRDTGIQKTYSDAQRAAARAQEVLTKFDDIKHAFDEADCAARRVTSPTDTGNIRSAKEKLERALTMGRLLAAELPDPLDNIQRAVSTLPDGHTKQSLLVLIDQTKQAALLVNQANTTAYEMEILQDQIEQWFEDAMDRVGGWYKRWTQQVLLGISIVLVLASNADTLMLVQRLSRDNALRESIVAAADHAIQNGDPSQKDTARQDLLAEASKMTLPIGWFAGPDDPYRAEQVPNCSGVPWSECVAGWGSKLLGLLMSILAVQLGAPFWFDTLNKFVNLRSAGTPPGQEPKSAPQSKKSISVGLETTTS